MIIKELSAIFPSNEVPIIRELISHYLDTGCSTKEYVIEMIDGLKSIYPGKTLVEIRDIIKGNKWKIISPNPDSRDKELYKWSINYDGSIFRGFTRREDRNKRRNEWSTVCKEAKENEDPIEHYAYKILGRKPWYEQTFEDYDEKESEMKRHIDQAIAAYLKDNEIWVRQPRKKSLKELEAAKRESRRLMKETRRENKLDDKLKEMTPTRILDKKVSKLRSMCYCTGESLRNGELCDICKLTKGVDSYMINLFKEAAEE